MPQEILNPALYADRTVQDWHRHNFPADHWAIDLDLMGACNRCREPLYLIEATTNPNKPHTILENLAQRARVPALVVIHDCEHIMRAYVLGPRVVLSGEEVVRTYLSEVRAEHNERDCARGRTVVMMRRR